MPAVTRPNERWSLDFVHDALSNGRIFRSLTIVDDFTRESIGIELDFSLTGDRVVRVLSRLAATRGLPPTLKFDLLLGAFMQLNLAVGGQDGLLYKLSVATPWWLRAVSPQIIRDVIGSHSFDVSVHLLTSVLGRNTDTIGVVKQDGKLLHAARRNYIEKNRLVAGDPIGYQQHVSFEYDLRKFRPNVPFTVTVANVVTREGVGAFMCAFDGSAFP